MTYKPCPKCGYRYTLRRRCQKCDPKPKKKRGDGRGGEMSHEALPVRCVERDGGATTK